MRRFPDLQPYKMRYKMYGMQSSARHFYHIKPFLKTLAQQ